jgi:hypothetical protein
MGRCLHRYERSTLGSGMTSAHHRGGAAARRRTGGIIVVEFVVGDHDIADAAGVSVRRGDRRRNATRVVDLTGLEAIADDAQRQEVLALLAQDDPQSLDVGVVELAVAR